MKSKLRTTLGAVLLSLAFGGAAHAASITGSINFAAGPGGGVTYGPGNNLATADQILSFDNPLVTEASGSFAAIPTGTSVSFTTPYTFDPSTAYSPLWSVSSGGTTFSFNLNSSFIEVQNSGFLAITGTGVFTGTGFEATPGVWRYTSQAPSADGRFSWSSSAAPDGRTVPDGGTTVALLGASLLGLHGARRKFGKR